MASASHIHPEVGEWYDSKNVPECFVVVDYDKDDIEIQYMDGEISHIDPETWDALHVEQIPEPEDATVAYEMEHEDILDFLNELEDSPDDSFEGYMKHLDSDAAESEWD